MDHPDLKRTRRQRRSQSAPASVDRLPPHSPEAELGVLGCLMLSPKETLAECVARFKGVQEAFYDLRHQTIYDECVAMWDEQEAIDLITLQQRLKNKNLLERIGGVAFLASLPDRVPSAANLSYYLDIVHEKFLLRKAVQVCTQTVGSICEFEGDVYALLDRVEADILQINDGRGGQQQQTLPEIVGTVTAQIETSRRGVGMISGIRTHLGYFDKMTGGLHRKEMAVLAGRPSTGKTSLMVTMLTNVARRERIPVGMFSMEMSKEDVVLRILCAAAEVNFHKLRTGYSEHGDIEKLAEVAPRVAALPLHIDDTPALGILEFRAKARRMAQSHGVRLIGVDYLQLMHGSKDFGGNRALEVGEISGGLKATAKELDAALLVASQLNRELERQKNRKPQLSDLRESGAIEQDADLAALLYKPKSENDEDEEEENAPERRVNAHIAKQRNGPTGDVEFLFRKHYMHFEDAYQNRGKQAPLPSNDELGISAAVKTALQRDMQANQTKPNP